MKLLVDTHTVLWMLDDPARLSERALNAVKDPGNKILLSAVVTWEIAIKRSIGKLEFDHQNYDQVILGAGGSELPVTLEHGKAVEHLPLHHRDPFDRLLIVQAQAEDATIVTSDSQFGRYDVSTLW